MSNSKNDSIFSHRLSLRKLAVHMHERFQSRRRGRLPLLLRDQGVLANETYFALTVTSGDKEATTCRCLG